MSGPLHEQKVRFAGLKPRCPREDEISVMKCFAKHINICHTCLIPKETKRIYLCPRGYGYAMDVRQYLYLKEGKVLSVADHCQGEIEVEVPRRYDAICRILSRRQTSGHPCQSIPHTQTSKLSNSTPSRSRVSGLNSNRAQSPASRQIRVKAEKANTTVYVTIPSITLPLQIRRSDSKGRYVDRKNT